MPIKTTSWTYIWIPAYAGMTSSFLEFIPNSIINGVCQQSEGGITATFVQCLLRRPHRHLDILTATFAPKFEL